MEPKKVVDISPEKLEKKKRTPGSGLLIWLIVISLTLVVMLCLVATAIDAGISANKTSLDQGYMYGSDSEHDTYNQDDYNHDKREILTSNLIPMSIFILLLICTWILWGKKHYGWGLALSLILIIPLLCTIVSSVFTIITSVYNRG